MHSAIKVFHKTDVTKVPSEDLFKILRSNPVDYLNRKWLECEEQFRNLKLGSDQIKSFQSEANSMVKGFCQHHINKVIAYQNCYHISPVEAFYKLRPKTDTKVVSERLGVRGVIDAIHNLGGRTLIIDYKTSKKNELDRDCLIQLGIYALLYYETYGKVPDEVGIHFLRHGEKIAKTTPELLALGEEQCKKVHNSTRNEKEAAYPKKISGLCKYKGGKCDFYDICI